MVATVRRRPVGEDEDDLLAAILRWRPALHLGHADERALQRVLLRRKSRQALASVDKDIRQRFVAVDVEERSDAGLFDAYAARYPEQAAELHSKLPGMPGIPPPPSIPPAIAYAGAYHLVLLLRTRAADARFRSPMIAALASTGVNASGTSVTACVTPTRCR